MKFTDIRQFTRSGSYQIDVLIDYLLKTLDGYKKHDNLQMNPDFQRGNVWTEEQQIKYVESIRIDEEDVQDKFEEP